MHFSGCVATEALQCKDGGATVVDPVRAML
jgi:hypothetical protein